MIIEGTDIEIPDSLVVPGDLYLRGTNVTSLPAGLYVVGYLYLKNTPINTLPEVLTVGGDLFLRQSKVTAMPSGLTVGGNLYASDGQLSACEVTQLEWVEKSKDMIHVFKAPTERAKLLHQMLWEL